MSVWKWTGSLQFGTGGGGILAGTGSPSGVVSAPVGTIFLRTDGGSGTTLYVKESGSGSSGWTAVSGGGGSGTPGGSDTQIQINESGSFGGDSTLTYDYTNHILNIGPAQAASNPSTIPQISLNGTATPFLVHTSAIWATAGISYTDNPTEVQESSLANCGIVVSRFYSPSGDTVGSHVYGFGIGVATDPSNTHSPGNADIRGGYINVTLGMPGLYLTDSIGLSVNISPAMNAGQTFDHFTNLVGLDVNTPLALNSNIAVYSAQNHIGIRIGNMGFNGFNNSTGLITNSYGVSIAQASGNPLGPGTIFNRAAIHIAQQSGQAVSNPWGILEDSVSEKNALGSVNIGGQSGPLISSGIGSPEGILKSTQGGLYLRTDSNSLANLYVKTTGNGLNTGWFALGTPYTITGFTGDNGIPPVSNQKLLRHIISGGVTAVSFAAGLSGSSVGCLNAPTSSYTMIINKNGVQVGTMTIGASATTGTFSFASTTSTVQGDVWDIIAPSTIDGTIAGIYFTITGTRS